MVSAKGSGTLRWWCVSCNSGIGPAISTSACLRRRLRERLLSPARFTDEAPDLSPLPRRRFTGRPRSSSDAGSAGPLSVGAAARVRPERVRIGEVRGLATWKLVRENLSHKKRGNNLRIERSLDGRGKTEP